METRDKENNMSVKENVHQLLRELPSGVELVAAIKGRSLQSVIEAIDAGVCTVGANYIQEAEKLNRAIGNRVRWHFIGYLQKNKVKKAVSLFDMIETVDSVELALEIDHKCKQSGKMMPVLVEINSGREPQKHGVFPENAEKVIRSISALKYIKITGLMTMGPLTSDSSGLRMCFKETKNLFDLFQRLEIPNVDMKCLSMGMSDSYRIAVEEGANIVRIGTKIFETT